MARLKKQRKEISGKLSPLTPFKKKTLLGKIWIRLKEPATKALEYSWKLYKLISLLCALFNMTL